ncbi:uncharacterized protein PV07_03119 [Cladophialophora immunda]|uniref:Enoyl reductase (ER) domain-containing protein n=1 Tax=Cladophialophora immunda TaxID=569365 RepID=A0A0D2B1I5_9EURO|nr:uncharacterized protein PV07_03119 [Cladophialophora immunda]KIW31472.1 hypothetical protein PV07_03119 [Cladophialophora immunda]
MANNSLNNSALWFRQFGEPLQALTFETAELNRRPMSKLRVRMSAAPINPSDLIPITGSYRHSVTPPRVAGYEGVGTVIEADEEAAELIGRRVLPLRGPGTWQTYVDCDPSWAVPVPDDIDDALAARSYINPLSAYLMLKRWPVKGKRVLLTGAGSACAGLLAQWAYDAGATELVGVYRSPERVASLTRLGVKPISIRSVAEGHAVEEADVVFDAVGGVIGTSILAGMSPEGDFISYGLLSGEPLQATANGVQARRFHLRDCLETTTPAEWQQWFCELWPLLRRAELPDTTSFPLEAWREALSLFSVPGRLSKPVLTMG